MTQSFEKPTGFENDLSGYQVVAYDACCGEPVAWGFKVIRHLGDERFNLLRSKYNLEYVSNGWVLIVKELTRDEAMQKYGAITAEEFGPRGGWKSVVFGEKKFFSKQLKSERK